MPIRIAFVNGKGGVGKTTVSVNLAVGLAALGHRVGLMDADVYGPNVPLMMGTNQTPGAIGERIQPLEQYDVKLMSMGFLNPGDKPLVWRGPMLHSVIQQFLRGVDWGELDYLIIDLPPGTGDAQLSLVQTIPLDGAILVTTPQLAAAQIARKGGLMFQKVNVPLLGVAENMSYFVDPMGKRHTVFGEGGGHNIAEALGTVLLGQIPLLEEIRACGDSGQPIVVESPEGEIATVFNDIAETLLRQLKKKPPGDQS